jgi:DNA sulfur modification protein DndE
VIINKIRISEKATNYLSYLRAKIKLTPNIVCRFALCLSISDPTPPDTRLDDEKGQEFSRYTLLGEYDEFYIGILKERMIEDGLDLEKDLSSQLKAHINRGVMMFHTRIKDLSDISDLIIDNEANRNVTQ